MTRTSVLHMTSQIYLDTTRPNWSDNHGHGLTVTEVTIHNRAHTPRLSDLSTEVLVLIFEQLRDIDHRALASARLLSKRLEAVATPIRFDTICLNERIIDPKAETQLPRFFKYLYSFTRHVKVNSGLDLENARRLLKRVQRLSSLRWRYVGCHPHSRFSFSTPSDMLSTRLVKAAKIRLYVENLPLKDFDSDSHDAYILDIPAGNLVSLKVTSPTPPLTTRLESLKRLLLEAPGVETFHYNDRGQGTKFSFRGDERLPAFKELLLQSYDWNHDEDAVRKHWDFSRLRHLALVDVPMFRFLSSVPLSEFHQLRTLRCEDSSTHLPDQRQETTELLYGMIQQIWALHEIRFTCHTSLFPVHGLLRHADTLRVLSFRDHEGFGNESRRCPTMRTEDLALLSRRLTKLHTLELDMDLAPYESSLFLRTLCDFCRLETLSLHTQTVLRPFDTVPNGTDPDFESAIKIVSALVRGKKGRPWQSITINVGGWKPVMIRRLSSAWREQNRRGIYAERCFVLERDADTGELVVLENVGVDNNCVWDARRSELRRRERGRVILDV